ncbi:transporter substrate-binding domain-containing protein [Mesorhizobium sp. 1B3]|uniref:transporter substrate-binding domain-containing protein n=1 Tax=Mesorhizobium sp. 1B3 TaxID=3243599 RepID=UPI003D9969D9
MTLSIPIGILFSRTGPYAAPGRQGFDGAMAAIEEINGRDDYPFTFAPAVADPEGNTDRYAVLCLDMVRRHGVRHVVGCTTSWSRKEVIPVVEKTDALLWYPCVYEGFEASENVVYVAACANQHLVPLLDYVVPRFGRNPVLLGSNYIWGWETNRIAREYVHRSGGEVVAERYIPIGDIDIERLVAEIRAKRPDFILNNLIGPSSYAFLRAYHALGQADADFRAHRRPVLSCNLYEVEAASLGEAVAGNYTVSCYFQSEQTERNRTFLESVRHNAGRGPISAFFAQSYASVFLIANAIRETDTDAIENVLAAAKAGPYASPFGDIRVDAKTNHVAMHAHIGRALADGTFEIVHRGKAAIDPDPFLTRTPLGIAAQDAEKPGHLRIVR